MSRAALLAVAGCMVVVSACRAVSSGESHEVTYLVTGSAHGADLTYTATGGDTAQQSGVSVPITRQGGDPGLVVSLFSGDFAYISAQNTGAHGDLTCQIEIDGNVVTTNTSSGGYTIAECSAPVP